MGADSIEFTINKKANSGEIERQFKLQQEQDRVYNGHREGYSGDFQTVNKIVNHTHKIFSSYYAAHDYCLEKAEKWVSVVAVYYYDVKIKPLKKLEKIKQKVIEIRRQLSELKSKPVKLAKFVTCEGCQSKVSSQHLRLSTSCPVCREGDFRPLSLQRNIKKLEVRIKMLEEQIIKLKQIEKEKLISKQKDDTNIKTLVAGWGAC